MSFAKSQYEGSKSTLCTGCGHDSVTQQIINACIQAKVNPYKVAKLSGIGCSSKTPAYFLSASHGFNTIHGRMSAVATGVHLANRDLTLIGVSGDGDTASIGLGSFSHLVRRNVPMVYIVENNGVYGLTKGQFSATSDLNSTTKSGDKNPFQGIDLCSLAIDLGATFVARSFSGDSKQLTPLISAALRHEGLAVLDVISPCITFANHEGSTKSYNSVKEHNIHLQEIGFVQPQAPLTADFEPGTTQEIHLHDGSTLLLKKIDGRTHDVKDRVNALKLLHDSRNKGEILTGLFVFDEESIPLAKKLNLSQKPLRDFTANELRPPKSDFERELIAFT